MSIKLTAKAEACLIQFCDELYLEEYETEDGYRYSLSDSHLTDEGLTEDEVIDELERLYDEWEVE